MAPPARTIANWNVPMRLGCTASGHLERERNCAMRPHQHQLPQATGRLASGAQLLRAQVARRVCLACPRRGLESGRLAQFAQLLVWRARARQTSPPPCHWAPLWVGFHDQLARAGRGDVAHALIPRLAPTQLDVAQLGRAPLPTPTVPPLSGGLGVGLSFSRFVFVWASAALPFRFLFLLLWPLRPAESLQIG